MTPELWERLKPRFQAALNGLTQNRDTTPRKPSQKIAERLAARAAPQVGETQDLLSTDRPAFEPAPFQPGHVLLDRFRIIRPIGRGGMGEVYEAEDLQLGKIALKTIRYGIGISRPVFEQFRQEVQLARKVSGTQICRIHELFLLPATQTRPAIPFLTMEYLDGVTLSEKLREEGPLPWKKVLPLALDMCEGLRLIHEKGIIHRDLKSSNIMLCEHAGATRVVLMDFGLASNFELPEDDDPSLFNRNRESSRVMLAGTPEYMAPEQFEGKPLSPATDIYALGIVLYELVTDLHPYAAHTPLIAAIRRARQPTPASSIGIKLPRHWDRIIARCLEYEPTKRFASAADVAKALRAGPANIQNIRSDRPWLLRTATLLFAICLAWASYSWWQTTQYYRPSPKAADWYKKGVDALADGTYLKATNSLRAATQLDPHFTMAHVRLAEALANLDFEVDAQHELLLATPDDHRLDPLDRMYFNAIHATISRKPDEAIERYKDILEHLPTETQKSIGLVDLGMAYEHAADLPHALEAYAKAAQQDDQAPAPYLHTAILQSRLNHIPEATKAFQQAEDLFTAATNQEGLAELDYQRGYALNARSDWSHAQTYLQQALTEAVSSKNVQLEIRARAQLSGAACISGQIEEAVKQANEAIRLARTNDLSPWAADGLFRLANARLSEKNYTEAERTLQEAIQLAHNSGQLRLQAQANITLASWMDKQQQPDQVIAPAQAALDYFRQNGFFSNATKASLLLIRAQKEKGEYSQALQSSKALHDVVVQSGDRYLALLSEENLGSIYFAMEAYPDALIHYQNARGLTSKTADLTLLSQQCFDTLWRLGRIPESDSMLSGMPAKEQASTDVVYLHIASLLSQNKYRDATTLAKKVLASNPSMDGDDKQNIELAEALAEAHLEQRTSALRILDEIATEKPYPANLWRSKLDMAEIALNVGRPQEARDLIAEAGPHFVSTGQLDSALRSEILSALASRELANQSDFNASMKKTVDTRTNLQQNWGLQAFQIYIARPDIQARLREIEKSAHPKSEMR
jgi:serine/threonine protein kinase